MNFLFALLAAAPAFAGDLKLAIAGFFDAQPDGNQLDSRRRDSFAAPRGGG